MKIKDYFLVGLVLILGGLLTNHKDTSAQGNDFSHIIPIDGGGQGTIRFFDTSNGKLYTYDRTLQEVMRVVQIEELGLPATELSKPSTETDLRYTNPRAR